jgi:hypothetical protein
MRDVVRHFSELKGASKASAQAVYKWPKTGTISRQNLEELARFLGCDPATAWLTGNFVDAKPAERSLVEDRSDEVYSAEPDVAALIHNKVKRLDHTAQLALLNLIEVIINVANPRYWEYITNVTRTTSKRGQPTIGL